ncbi:MAG: Ig-like domain-containing protein, partial [Acidobacteria bacterium]|nr:Ig-like domain-containing protein [Acidobacteriota bacterium]
MKCFSHKALFISALIFLFFFVALPAFAQTVARVDITADTTILMAGQTITATARAKDADGNVIPNIQFTWSSSNTNIATVDASGLVTTRNVGTVQIRARAPNNVQGTLTLTLIPARIELTAPETVRLSSSTTLTVLAFDIRNNPIPNVAFTWSSDNTAVATVTNSGVVQAVGLGEAVISAAYQGFSDTRLIRVVRVPDFTLERVVTTDLNEGSGSQIQSILSTSNINSRGDIAFVANLSGKTTAILRDIQGQVTALARTGDPAPFGGTYNSFSTPSINSRGEAAFVATVSNGLGPLLLLARGNELFVLILSGDILEVGGTIGTITLQPDGLDDNGFVTVHLTVTNPNHSGVFRVSPETGIRPLIRTFDEVSIGIPTALGPVSVSPEGRAAVLVTAGARRGIYLVSSEGSATPVVVDGAQAPTGTPFMTFAAIRSISDGELFFTATAQGGATSIYRWQSNEITEVVRGGRESASRTISITSLWGGIPGTILFVGNLSDQGTGVFAWTGGSITAVALRNSPMNGGEILTRADGAWINASGVIHLFGVSDRRLSASYRIATQGSALRWATGSIVPVLTNYNVVFSSTLRPGPNVAYFLAGSPFALFQKSGDVVTPIAVPGMRTPRGVYTGVTYASSNPNGEAFFVATVMDLTRLTTTSVLYRYAAGSLMEEIVFGGQMMVAGLGSRTIAATGLNGIGVNSAGQFAFVGGIDGRQTLLLSGSELRPLVQAGTASPTGGAFTGFTNVQLTTSGAVVFTGIVSGGPSGGIFLASDGQVTSVAATANYAGLGAPAVGGDVIYFGAGRADTAAIWAYTNGAVRQVIAAGALLPINTAITGINSYAAQEDGTVVFNATSGFSGLFARGPDGRLSTVALVLEPTPLAGRFSSFGVIAVANSAVIVNAVLSASRSAVFVAWPVGRQSTPPVTSRDFSVVNRSAVSLQTNGQAATTNVGYATVRAAPGSSSPSALAIFSLRRDNTLVSEATVQATTLVQEGRIYAEISGPANTGIAIANPGSQPATVTFYFTDLRGTDFGAGTTTLAAGEQIARFLNQAPFNAGSTVSGTFTFASSQPVSVIALRSYVNERSDFLMTTLPVASLASSSGSVFFPHFADGDGWRSQIVLVNPTSSPLTGSIQFLGRVASTTNQYTVPPKSSYVAQTPGTATALDTGWVRVNPSGGSAVPSGLLIFSLNRAGVRVTEAGVPSSAVGTAFRLYLESAGNINAGQVGAIQTGIAIVNPGDSAVTVTLDATNLSGASMGIVGRLTVPARGQVATFVNQISGMETLLAAQGVLRVAASGPVAVMGLRGRYNERSDFLVTTIEPTNETVAPAPGDRYLPH